MTIKIFTPDEWGLMIQAGSDLSQSIFAMLADHDRWTTEVHGIIYRHDTGVLIQLRRDPHYDGCVDDRNMVVWMDDMTPFAVHGDHPTGVVTRKFFYEMRHRDAQATMERVGVIAKLCVE